MVDARQNGEHAARSGLGTIGGRALSEPPDARVAMTATPAHRPASPLVPGNVTADMQQVEATVVNTDVLAFAPIPRRQGGHLSKRHDFRRSAEEKGDSPTFGPGSLLPA